MYFLHTADTIVIQRARLLASIVLHLPPVVVMAADVVVKETRYRRPRWATVVL